MVGRYIFECTYYSCSEYHHSFGDRELRPYNLEESTIIYAFPAAIGNFFKLCPWCCSGLQGLDLVGLLILISILQDLLWTLAWDSIYTGPSRLWVPDCLLPYGLGSVCFLSWGPRLRDYALGYLVWLWSQSFSLSLGIYLIFRGSSGQGMERRWRSMAQTKDHENIWIIICLAAKSVIHFLGPDCG